MATNNSEYNAANQITGTNSHGVQVPPSYDGSGDITWDGVNSYLYDANGRLCAVASTPVPGFTTMTGYLYDPSGVRVSKGSISAWNCDPSQNNYKTIQDYVIGPSGDAISEVGMDSNGSMFLQRTYVSADGRLIATYDPDGLHFRATDWLGSFRAGTDAQGEVEEYSSMLPFGDQLTGDVNSPDPHHFTGKERDTESGNDYFGARYYSSAMGRFLSPDWAAKEEPVPYATFDDPQSLNLYSYVRNNPLSRADADGHCGEDLCIVEGSVTAYFVGAAAIAGTAAVLSTPAAQRSLSTFTSAASANFSSNVSALKSTVSGWFSKKSADKPSTLSPGPHAGDGTPARSGDRNFTPGERGAVNAEGAEKGCHTCGTTDPGTKSGNFVPDHQPPTALNPAGGAQTLYPQCIGCSRTQGGEVNAAKQQAPPPPPPPKPQPPQ